MDAGGYCRGDFDRIRVLAADSFSAEDKRSGGGGDIHHGTGFRFGVCGDNSERGEAESDRSGLDFGGDGNSGMAAVKY